LCFADTHYNVIVYQAQQLNKDIFETIYYHSLKASAEIAANEGPYETYVGRPASKVCLMSVNMLFICAEYLVWLC
jgi:hypothetical protein